MRKVFIASVFWIMLLLPLTGSTHELSPTHYPLGLLPILIAPEMWLIIFLLPIVLSVETFVLRVWARELGVKANLWRVGVQYVVARAAETAAYFSLGGIGPLIGWNAPGWSSSVPETFGSLLFCLVVGFIPKVMTAFFLYRRTSLTTAQITRAVGSATLSGYLSAVVWSLIVHAIV